MTAHPTGSPSIKQYRFRSLRAFKALDNGKLRKWILVVAARDMPRDLPLDANARVPNVVKNPTCTEMRETLLTRPEMFQIFNGGVVCTASSVDVHNEDGEQWVDVAFDQDQLQGVVNGGHTYGCLLHVIHDNAVYAEGMTLKAVLAKKDKIADNPTLASLIEDDQRLADHIGRAREYAQVQVELVAPVSDAGFLHDIARARNLSQSVDQTALQNLAGKYDQMKKVLREAPAPFGPSFVERVVWKTNQEVPEDSSEVSVKTLIHVLALMNTRRYKPGVKAANEVYNRSGLIVREFGEAEGEDSSFYDKLTVLLPEFIALYDYIYMTLPETEPSFPWADSRSANPTRPKTASTTPLLARTCSSKVSGAFIWPIFSAFRLLLEDGTEGLRFKTDPIKFFEDKKGELSGTIQNAFENQGRVTHQVGKATDAWIRLEGQIEMEMMIRDRIAPAASLPSIVAPQAKAPEAASSTVILSRNAIHAPADGYARVTYVPSGKGGGNVVITRTLFGVPSTQGKKWGTEPLTLTLSTSPINGGGVLTLAKVNKGHGGPGMRYAVAGRDGHVIVDALALVGVGGLATFVAPPMLYTSVPFVAPPAPSK